MKKDLRISNRSVSRDDRARTANKGYTIVELLVVIILISILAAIILVSYIGITRRANIDGVEIDLANNSRKLQLYKTLYGSYPTAIDGNHCPTSPNMDVNYCLIISKNNSFTSYTGGTETYELLLANDGVGTYKVTPTTQPTEVVVGTGPPSDPPTNMVEGSSPTGGIYTMTVVDTGAPVTQIKMYVYGSPGCNGTQITDIPPTTSGTVTANWPYLGNCDGYLGDMDVTLWFGNSFGWGPPGYTISYY